MKRGKKGVGGAANFWPGYVDAMVNVVLNLLFMVALFGITLAVFSKQSKKGADGDTETQTEAEAEATALSPPDATLGWPAQDVPPTPLLRDPDNAGDPTNIRAPSAPVVSGPLGPTRLGDNMGRADTGGASANQSAPSGSGAAPVNAPGAGQALRPGRQSGPDATDIVVADAFARKAGPPVTVTRRATSSGQVILTLDAESGADPVGAFNRASVAAALKENIRPNSRKVKLWTSIPRADPNMRRSAYLALTTLRNQLITAGVPASAMEVRVYEGAGSASGGLRLFVVTEP
jgi:hypothetical protein